MEQKADSVTRAVPTSLAPAVASHAIKPFANSHDPDSVGRRDIIVFALAAPGNPGPGPFRATHNRRTFWTACASCKRKSKYPIEHLDCNISCLQCSEIFKATEVSRPPRNQQTTTTENVNIGAIVTSPRTKVEPSRIRPTVETPLPKRLKRDNIVTQAKGKLEGSFDAGEIRRVMISKGWNKLTERMNIM